MYYRDFVRAHGEAEVLVESRGFSAWQALRAIYDRGVRIEDM